MKTYPKELIAYDENYYTDGKIYDKFAHTEGNDIFQHQGNMIVEILGDLTGKKVLDIGGGLGIFTKRLREFGADAWCQEVSKYACENSPIKEFMVCQDVGVNIPFQSDNFELVTALESIEHIKDLDLALKEIYRVVKPNWYFYCTIGLDEGRGHYRIGSLEEWECVIEKYGFKINRGLTDEFRKHPIVKQWGWHPILLVKPCI